MGTARQQKEAVSIRIDCYPGRVSSEQYEAVRREAEQQISQHIRSDGTVLMYAQIMGPQKNADGLLPVAAVFDAGVSRFKIRTYEIRTYGDVHFEGEWALDLLTSQDPERDGLFRWREYSCSAAGTVCHSTGPDGCIVCCGIRDDDPLLHDPDCPDVSEIMTGLIQEQKTWARAVQQMNLSSRLLLLDRLPGQSRDDFGFLPMAAYLEHDGRLRIQIYGRPDTRRLPGRYQSGSIPRILWRAVRSVEELRQDVVVAEWNEWERSGVLPVFSAAFPPAQRLQSSEWDAGSDLRPFNVEE